MRTTESTSAGATKSLRIVTPFRSVVEFIHRYCSMVDEHTMAVALEQARPRGASLRFSVHLADGKTMFQGSGRILSLEERGGGASLGATIELGELDDESRTMHRCLLIAAKVAGTGTMRTVAARPPSEPAPLPPPPRVPARGSAAPELPSGSPTHATSASSLMRLAYPLPPPPVEPRRLSEAEMHVPANPLGDITPEFLDQFIEAAMSDSTLPRRSDRMPTVPAKRAASSGDVRTVTPHAAEVAVAAETALVPVPPPLVPVPLALMAVPAPLAPAIGPRPGWRGLVAGVLLVALVILLAYLG